MLAVKRASILAIDEVYDETQLRAWAPDDGMFDVFTASTTAEQYVVQVALTDDDVIGYGVLEIPHERIDALFVQPRYQGQQIATTLYRQLETSARFSEIPKLTVVAAVTVTEFYESLGFDQLDTITKEIDGVRLPFARMERELPVVEPAKSGDLSG